MAISLRAKLAAMTAPTAPATAAPPPNEALLVREFRAPALPRVLALRGAQQPRLGFDRPLDAQKCVFLDTETTGLSGGAGTVAFLAGLGTIEGDSFVVRQYFMHHYALESQLLAQLECALRGRDTIVSFNGKSFDVPLLLSRFGMCRLRTRLREMAHLDLIHPARRAWKLRLRDCSLGNLEREVLALAREGDLPGSEVPQRYFDYLKTGDFAPIEDVLRHNRQDILSLQTLLARLLATYASPCEQQDMLDVFSLGRAMERQGERAEAGKCYALASTPPPRTSLASLRAQECAGKAGFCLAMLHKRAGELAAAEAAFRRLIARRQMGTLPYVELAKLYEHRQRDAHAALLLAREALPLARDEIARAALEKRVSRLARKCERAQKAGAQKTGATESSG